MAGRPRSFDRDEALSSALDVFWAKGYADASLTDLTSAMGINAPSLYAAFGSKETLFREAVRLYSEREGAILWRSMREALTARDAIEGLLLATANASGRCGRPQGCLIALSGVNPDALPDKACSEVKQVRVDSLASMRDRLEAAKAAGELASTADPAAIAAFYLTVQQGMTFRARDGAGPEELTATARAAMLAWDGLAGIRRH